MEQWEALALLLIGISVNQLRSLPEGTTALGLPVATGAYMYTLIFVSAINYSINIQELILLFISLDESSSFTDNLLVSFFSCSKNEVVNTLMLKGL